MTIAIPHGSNLLTHYAMGLYCLPEPPHLRVNDPELPWHKKAESKTKWKNVIGGGH